MILIISKFFISSLAPIISNELLFPKVVTLIFLAYTKLNKLSYPEVRQRAD